MTRRPISELTEAELLEKAVEYRLMAVVAPEAERSALIRLAEWYEEFAATRHIR
jgi:hypothetical protein